MLSRRRTPCRLHTRTINSVNRFWNNIPPRSHILFYYKALTNNPVNAVGFGMHGKPAREFFAPAKEAYAAAEDKGAALAYLLGFVCHFALDSACHGYIENKIAVSGVTHTEIESEFDRSLLLQDGRDPLSAKLTYHIAARPASAQARVRAAVPAPDGQL